ncbi:unnamed protein product, partial [Ectocarpus sp. 13 AM-2016]
MARRMSTKSSNPHYSSPGWVEGPTADYPQYRAGIRVASPSTAPVNERVAKVPDPFHGCPAPPPADVTSLRPRARVIAARNSKSSGAFVFEIYVDSLATRARETRHRQWPQAKHVRKGGVESREPPLRSP